MPHAVSTSIATARAGPRPVVIPAPITAKSRMASSSNSCGHRRNALRSGTFTEACGNWDTGEKENRTDWTAARACLAPDFPRRYSLISGIAASGSRGVTMKKDRITADQPIDLDSSELLGFSQVAKVSGTQGKSDDLGRLLSKIGPGGEVSGAPAVSRLLSKIGTDGEVSGAPAVSRLLSKISSIDGETGTPPNV